MPKLKIGEKQVAGDSSSTERKIFNNGHKSFDAMAAKILVETQTRERRTLANFELNKSKIMKPRNPITAEITPRKEYNLAGDKVLETGMLLFPPNQTYPETMVQTTKLKALNPSRLRVGGHDASFEEIEGNPLARPSLPTQRIASLQNLQDHMGGEIEYLRYKQKQAEDLLKAMPSSKRL